MARRKRLLFDHSTYAYLMPNAIPADLAALGWRFEGRTHAGRRDPSGSSTGAALLDMAHNGRPCFRWRGMSDLWGIACTTQDDFFGAVEAMRAVEAAEVEGRYSNRWRDWRGTPKRDGWTHLVRRKRDVWHWLAPDQTLLVVFQAPVEAWQHGFWIAVNGEVITRDDSAPLRIDDPVEAMLACESEAYVRGHPLYVYRNEGVPV